MDKQPDCKHQWPDEAECQPAFKNTYYCPDCDIKWTDIWSATCDDECAACGKDYEPTKSQEIADCACRYFKHQNVLHQIQYIIGGT